MAQWSQIVGVDREWRRADSRDLAGDGVPGRQRSPSRSRRISQARYSSSQLNPAERTRSVPIPLCRRSRRRPADSGPPPAPAPPPNSEPGTIPSVDGSEPGVFGGTMNQTTCDAEGLITFLGQDPDRAGAWAGVVKIAADDIPAFIRDLTPVLLRADTRVTDHRYVDGSVAPRQAVLEQGTAVLVNKFGEPTVRCYSGNPLLAPIATPVAPRYVGPAELQSRPPGRRGGARRTHARCRRGRGSHRRQSS